MICTCILIAFSQVCNGHSSRSFPCFRFHEFLSLMTSKHNIAFPVDSHHVLPVFQQNCHLAGILQTSHFQTEVFHHFFPFLHHISIMAPLPLAVWAVAASARQASPAAAPWGRRPGRFRAGARRPPRCHPLSAPKSWRSQPGFFGLGGWIMGSMGFWVWMIYGWIYGVCYGDLFISLLWFDYDLADKNIEDITQLNTIGKLAISTWECPQLRNRCHLPSTSSDAEPQLFLSFPIQMAHFSTPHRG